MARSRQKKLEGMEIITNSPKAVEARRASVELILSNHEKNCLQCPKNGHCELLHVAEMVGARDQKYVGDMTEKTVDEAKEALEKLGLVLKSIF